MMSLLRISIAKLGSVWSIVTIGARHGRADVGDPRSRILMQIRYGETATPPYKTPNSEKHEKGPHRQPNPQTNLEGRLLGLIWADESKQPVNMQLHYP